MGWYFLEGTELCETCFASGTGIHSLKVGMDYQKALVGTNVPLLSRFYLAVSKYRPTKSWYSILGSQDILRQILNRSDQNMLLRKEIAY